MEKTIMNALKKRSDYLDKMITFQKKSLENVPEGSLRIKSPHGYVQYYFKNEKDKEAQLVKYIPADQNDFAMALAQKAYDEDVLKAAVQEKVFLEKMIRKFPEPMPENVYAELSDARKQLVKPIIETDEAFVERWLAAPYEKNTRKKSRPEIMSESGDTRDSKSEMLISNLLDKRRKYYLPQFPINLKGFGKVYADFKVLNLRTRKEYIWEHLGMLDNPNYLKHNIAKINAYILNGYIPGKNLILTFEAEDSPLNLKVADRLITEYLD